MLQALRKRNLWGLAALGLLVAACAGTDGAPGAIGPAGADGAPGEGCTVTDNGDGTKTFTCDDGTTTVVANGTNGANGTDGANGANGINGTDGTDVDPATLAKIQAQLEKLSATEPESCAVCHGGGGQKHQATYKSYADASALTLEIDDVTSVDKGSGTFDTTMTFTILKNGLPYIDANGLPTLEQKRFTAVRYDSATSKFDSGVTFGAAVAVGNGVYTSTAKGIAYAPEDSNAEVYAYVADGVLETEGMTLYDDVASAALSFGDADTYDSAANVAGCQKCHGTPYMKHGYRAAKVENLSDFGACKVCHYDTRKGNHQAWQLLVDDPLRSAAIHEGSAVTAAEKTKYAYKASLMNDVHMSHAMEFPYPQSMANCTTCHEGKLDRVLTDANFKAETCKSCHALTGSALYGTSARALATLMPTGHDLTMDCASCHKAGGIAPTFKTIHPGYDKKIYTAAGTKYADMFSVSVDSASYNSTTHVLNVKFSATEAAASTITLNKEDIVPTLLIGLYGYDTKDFLVAAHGSDADKNRLLEFPVDGVTANPRFTTVSRAGGAWEVNVNLTMWADKIGDVVRRAEIAVMPDLRLVVGAKDTRTNGETNDQTYAVTAPSRTFAFASNGFDDTFYKDIVKVNGGCNNCHEALGTTFHSPDRSGNIRVCRVCHESSSAGSHLEMQSRSIDSYVHAIHSFQVFDPGDVDFNDPVEKMRAEMHVEHTYPNFTIKNCESCHVPGSYDVPDQSRTLPGLLSGSDTVEGRRIGTVAAYVTGPATRACGACHRADLINEDNVNGLAAFYAHTKAGGYMVKNETGVWNALVTTILSMFE